MEMLDQARQCHSFHQDNLVTLTLPCPTWLCLPGFLTCRRLLVRSLRVPLHRNMTTSPCWGKDGTTTGAETPTSRRPLDRGFSSWTKKKQDRKPAEKLSDPKRSHTPSSYFRSGGLLRLGPRLPLVFTPQLCTGTCCPSRHGKEAQDWTTKQGLKTPHRGVDHRASGRQGPRTLTDRQFSTHLPSLPPTHLHQDRAVPDATQLNNPVSQFMERP